jgi:hypothetical protein
MFFALYKALYCEVLCQTVYCKTFSFCLKLNMYAAEREGEVLSQTQTNTNTLSQTLTYTLTLTHIHSARARASSEAIRCFTVKLA